MEATATNDFKAQSKSKSPLAVDQSQRDGQSSFESHFPMEETFNQIKQRTSDAYDSSIQLVKRNPLSSIAIALGVGAAAGYLLKRR